MSKLWWLVLGAWLCLVYNASAGDYAFKYGMGLFNGEKTGNIKIFAIRNESLLAGPIHSAREGGLWVDNLGDGRSGAAYGKYQLGVKPGSDTGFYAKVFWGVQLQSTTDTQLGGNFQFSQDFRLGFRDETSLSKQGTPILVAPGFIPNRGRDFLTLSAGVRF